MDEARTNAERLERLSDELRRRFTDVASRRVAGDDVDDVVQEAMRVVIEKSRDPDAFGGLPPIAWSMQVLRNTIGNHYKRERTRRRWTETNDDADPPEGRAPVLDQPLEALESTEALALIASAIEAMRDGPCGTYLARLVDGTAPGAIAEEAGVEPSAFYKRLLRCREKLRLLLLERGVDA